ncbi:hypothetical protein [Actinoplanes aureus]|uniref:Flagellar biosynthesis protein FlgA n=1 Tax=Actinoplanes aureus TaxID=2792083 RepID=A0A931CIB7_9ACTN|nr:hypothetical protein [Actinoplanes aureus]MBG0569119.1 hypothetical protein [Actinoplanes aureus]
MPRSNPDRQGERLDPVRWRGPSRGSLLRLGTVAVLLITAAAVLWTRPTSCAPVIITASSSAPAKPAVAPGTAGAVPPGSVGAVPPGSVGAVPPGSVGAVPPGSVGVPVRLADPAALAVVRPGNRVDLLRLEDDAGRRTTPVASSALVLDVTGKDDPVTGGLLLALSPREAERAVAAPGRGFAILIRPG